MKEILYLFIGALLAFLSSWVIEGYKNKKKNEENEKTIRSLLKQELSSISKDLEKLKNVLEYKNYFEIKLINFLNEKVGYLGKYKKDLTSLPKLKDREVMIELISDLKSFLFDLGVLENIALDDPKKSETERLGAAFISQKRLEKLVMLVEIQRRVEEAYKKYE